MTSRPTPKARATTPRTPSRPKDSAPPKTQPIAAGTSKQAKKPSAAAAKPAQLGTDAVIMNAQTKQQKPAITSDRWHVVHSQWSAKRAAGQPPFARRIASEHSDKAAAVVAAKQLAAELKPTMTSRATKDRDQVLVRPPRYRSLKYKSVSVRSGPG